METLLQCFVKLVQIFDGLFIVNSAAADSISLTIPPCLSTSTLRSWIRQLGHGLDGWAFLPIETSSVSKPERKFSGFFQVPWCGETRGSSFGLRPSFVVRLIRTNVLQVSRKLDVLEIVVQFLDNALIMLAQKRQKLGSGGSCTHGCPSGNANTGHWHCTRNARARLWAAPRLGLGACDVPTLICSDSLFSANTQIRMWLGMAFRCCWSFERFLQVSAPKPWISCVNLLRAIECRIGSLSIHPASPVMYLSKPLPARMAPTRKFGRSCWMFRKTSCVGIVHV